MASIKLATFNIEWMIALFGLAKDADSLANPEIPGGRVEPRLLIWLRTPYVATKSLQYQDQWCPSTSPSKRA